MLGFIILVIIAIFIVRVFLLAAAEKQKRERIYQKYGHTETAEKIINKVIWVGETSEQLEDSLGKPVDIDEQVLKTKRKEIWKYHPKETNRYGLKISVENGIVIGWDEKL